MKVLRLCQAAASAAAHIGLSAWAVFALGYLARGDKILWLLSYAFGGGALIAGIIAAGLWAVIAIRRTIRNLEYVAGSLPPASFDAPYVEDRSEELTRAAMKRAGDAYRRSLEPSFFQDRGAL